MIFVSSSNSQSFSCRFLLKLLDEMAILACAAYVDLNPIRAALAETIEESDFTSAQKRAAGLRRECSVASVQLPVFSCQCSVGSWQ